MDKEQRWVRERDGERERTARSRVAMRRVEGRGKSGLFEGVQMVRRRALNRWLTFLFSFYSALPLVFLCSRRSRFVGPCFLCRAFSVVRHGWCSTTHVLIDLLHSTDHHRCSKRPRTSTNMYQLTSWRLCRCSWVRSVRRRCSRVRAVRMAASRPSGGPDSSSALWQ